MKYSHFHFLKIWFFSPPPSLDTTLLMFRVPQSSPALHTCWTILSIPLVSEGKYTEDSAFYDISPDLSPKLQTHLSSWSPDTAAPLHKPEAPQPERIFFLLYIAPSVLSDITGDSVAQKKTWFSLTHIFGYQFLCFPPISQIHLFLHLHILNSGYHHFSSRLIILTVPPDSILTIQSIVYTVTQEFFHKCQCHSFI